MGAPPALKRLPDFLEHSHEGETELTFNWSESDCLEEPSFDRLFDQVGRITRLKRAGLSLPISIAFEIPTGPTHGSGSRELRLEFEAAVRQCSGALKITSDGNADVRVAVSEEMLRADVSGLTSATFHLGPGVYPDDTEPSQVATDALALLAVALAKAGHGEPAVRVATPFFADSLISALPPLAAQLAAAMIQAGRVTEAISIATTLDDDDENDARRLASGLFMEVLHQAEPELQSHELEGLEAARRRRLEKRVGSGEDEHAGAAAQNLGLQVLRAGRHEEAVDLLEQAIRLAPAREEELSSSLAGAYFLSGRAERAVRAYERVIELGKGSPQIEARRADALMHSGRYEDALAAFSMSTEDRQLSAWVYVKTRTLDWVIVETGISEQERDPSAAEKLAAPNEGQSIADAQEQARRVWEKDALSSLGWFNYAHDLLREGREADAMHAYLTAAVMREGDVESWVNVALLAGATADEDLLATSAITGSRLNDPGYMQELVRQLRLQLIDPKERDLLLDGIERIIAEGGD